MKNLLLIGWVIITLVACHNNETSPQRVDSTETYKSTIINDSVKSTTKSPYSETKIKDSLKNKEDKWIDKGDRKVTKEGKMIMKDADSTNK